MDFKWIFFIVTGVICALILATVKNKARFLLFLIGLFWVFPTGFIFYHYTGILLVDIPLIALLIMSLSSGKKFKWYYKGFTPALLIMIVWMSFSSFQAINVGWAIAQISKWIRGYLIFVVVANNIKNFKDLNTVIVSLLSGFLFESFLGIYHWRAGVLGLWFLGEKLIQAEPWRSYGTFFVPSFFANYLCVLLPLFMRLSIYYKHPEFKDRIFYFGSFLLGILALYTTYGRSSWIGFVISCTIIVFISLFQSKFRPKVKWPLIFLIVFGAGFVISYIPYMTRQFGSERQSAVDIRYIQWDTSIRMIKDNALFGSGPDNYELLSPQYIIRVPQYPYFVLIEMVHNSYLLMTAEGGIVVGLAFIWLLAQYFIRAFPLLKSKSSLIVNIAFGVPVGIFSLMISFMASPDIHSEQTINQMLICGGLLMGCASLNKKIDKMHMLKKMQYKKKMKKVQSQENQSDIPNKNVVE